MVRNSRAWEMTVHRRDAENAEKAQRRERREEKLGRNGFDAKFEG
jgi:hypothetical protein